MRGPTPSAHPQRLAALPLRLEPSEQVKPLELWKVRRFRDGPDSLHLRPGGEERRLSAPVCGVVRGRSRLRRQATDGRDRALFRILAAAADRMEQAAADTFACSSRDSSSFACVSSRAFDGMETTGRVSL